MSSTPDEADMGLYDLRVTVDSIAGRSVCGLSVGDYFELTTAHGSACPPAGTSASARWPPRCRCWQPSSASCRRGLAGARIPVACPDPEERLVMRITRTAPAVDALV